MAVLILAKHDNSTLNDATARTVTAAKGLGGDIHVLVAGQNCAAVAEEASKVDGVAKVIHVEGASYAHRLAEPLTALLHGMAGAYDAIAFPATTTGKNVAPRLAALLDVMVISDVTGIVSADTFERPIYAGNAIQTVQSADAKKIITVRGAGFDPAGEQAPCPVETAAAGDDPALSKWIEDKVAKSDRPELASAKIVVSGGRGVGSQENFAIISHLADKLGAAVGASRARRRQRLRPQRLAGRPDRQGRRPRPLHRHRHLRRHPAPRRHEGQQDHRRDQQGRGGPDLPGRRLRLGWGSFHAGAGTGREAGLDTAGDLRMTIWRSPDPKLSTRLHPFEQATARGCAPGQILWT